MQVIRTFQTGVTLIGDVRYGPAAQTVVRLIQELHQAGRHSRDKIVNFGKQVYNLVPPRRYTFDDVTAAFIEAHDGLTLWHASHAKTGDTTYNHVALVLAGIYGHALPYTPQGEERLLGLLDSFSATSHYYAGTPAGQLAYSRAGGVLQLATDYQKKATAIEVLQQRIPHLDQWDLSDQAVDRYRRQAEELAGYLSAYTAYGVKPCFTQDSMLHTPKDAWVMMDGPEETGKLPEFLHDGLATPMAILNLTERSNIKRVSHVYDNSFGDNGKTGVLTPGHRIEMSATVGFDGRLFADAAYGMIPLEHSFQAAGQERLFPLFWLIQLMRLSDLVIPISKRREHDIPSPPPLTGPRKQRERQAEKLPGEFPKLWLPRLRALADKNTPSAINAEVEEDKSFTRQTSRKAPEHVTGHWRRLLPHQKASPEAIGWALREREKTPPEGYTYVKRRGQSTGHEARRRRS